MVFSNFEVSERMTESGITKVTSSELSEVTSCTAAALKKFPQFKICELTLTIQNHFLLFLKSY